MTTGSLINIMRYLGYVTHFEDGTLNPIAEAVANELSARGALESIMLSTYIAESWAKHARQARRAK